MDRQYVRNFPRGLLDADRTLRGSYGRYRFFLAGLVDFTVASFLGGSRATERFDRHARGARAGCGIVNPAALSDRALDVSARPGAFARDRDVGNDRQRRHRRRNAVRRRLVQYSGLALGALRQRADCSMILCLDAAVRGTRPRHGGPPETRRRRGTPPDRAHWSPSSTRSSPYRFARIRFVETLGGICRSPCCCWRRWRWSNGALA